jgi:cytochrome c oxidase subunit 2
MLWITFAITGAVFFLTQILLFWFAFKYQFRPDKKAFYYPHNNKLEMIWTTVPAITLCILVGFGIYYWVGITGEAPANAMQVEVTGKQFGWIFRYPGKDNHFGKKYFRNINNENNELGILWEDPASHDDVVVSQTMYLVKDQPVKLIIGSRDVIHDVGLPHFRMKMDAVPGTPTTMWFTPKYTTEEMKKITNNPDFEYEIACDQMCGNGHYSMKGIVKVVSPSEYILWRAQQKTAYSAINVTPPDTTQKSAPVVSLAH